MTLFGLFGALSIALVAGQLDTVQYAALMMVYNATGAAGENMKRFLFFSFFFVAHLAPGCDTTKCPRVGASQTCMMRADNETGRIACNGTSIVYLCGVWIRMLRFADGSRGELAGV